MTRHWQHSTSLLAISPAPHPLPSCAPLHLPGTYRNQDFRCYTVPSTPLQPQVALLCLHCARRESEQRIDEEIFSGGLLDLGVSATREELGEIFKSLDKAGNGSFEYAACTPPSHYAPNTLSHHQTISLLLLHSYPASSSRTSHRPSLTHLSPDPTYLTHTSPIPHPRTPCRSEELKVLLKGLAEAKHAAAAHEKALARRVKEQEREALEVECYTLAVAHHVATVMAAAYIYAHRHHECAHEC